MKKILTFAAVLSFSLSACTDRKIVLVPANPNLDPIPVPAQKISGQADPQLSQQWAATKLGLNKVWASTPGSRRVTVAMVGSGIDYNHEDLRESIWINPKESLSNRPGMAFLKDQVDADNNGYKDDFLGYDFVENDGFPFDRTGTGTAAAGVIAATHDNGKGIRGIAKNVSIVPVRYISGNGQGTVPRLVESLKYAATIKADVVFVHLANMKFAQGPRGSMGEKVMKIEQEALEAVLKIFRDNLHGTPIIVSAGNSGSSISKKSELVISKFAEFDNVLVVTSTDEKDQLAFVANYGMETVDLAAPGEGILTTAPGNKYSVESGSYLAAAHVAGAMALAISIHHNKKTTAEIFKDGFLSDKGGDEVSDLEFKTVSGNRLNIEKFLGALL